MTIALDQLTYYLVLLIYFVVATAIHFSPIIVAAVIGGYMRRRGITPRDVIFTILLPRRCGWHNSLSPGRRYPHPALTPLPSKPIRLATRADAEEQRGNAKDVLADILFAVPAVAEAIAGLTPLVAPYDRKFLARRLAKARQWEARSFEAHACLIIDSKEYDLKQAHTPDEFERIRKAYRRVWKLATKAAHIYSDIAELCEQLRHDLDHAPEMLKEIAQELRATLQACAAFRDDGFELDLSRWETKARTRIEAAQAALAAGNRGMVVDRAYRTREACNTLQRKMRRERRLQARLTLRVAELAIRIDAQDTVIQTAARQIDQMMTRHGPTSVENLAGADFLSGLLREAIAHQDEAVARIGKQDWIGAREAVDAANELLERLNERATALAAVYHHLYSAFRACRPAIREIQLAAGQLRAQIRKRLGSQDGYMTRAEDLSRRVDAQSHRLAPEYPDYPAIKIVLDACRAELAAIATASFAEHERAGQPAV